MIRGFCQQWQFSQSCQSKRPETSRYLPAIRIPATSHACLCCSIAHMWLMLIECLTFSQLPLVLQLLCMTPCPVYAQVGGVLNRTVDSVTLAICYPGLFTGVSRVTLTPARAQYMPHLLPKCMGKEVMVCPE